MKNLFNLLVMVLSSMLLLSSCEKIDDILPKSKSKIKIYRGESVDLGNGQGTAWISVNKDGVPVELGLELTPEALLNLPPTNFSVDIIPLPPQAKELTPFDHIQIDWASQGHGMVSPSGPVHIGPHYDIRFYMTSLEERLAIPDFTDPAGKFNISPPTGYMPANYSPGSRLKGIGRHWGDGMGFHGMTHSLILGTYNGKLTFISPIVTIEELQSRNKTSMPYAQPQFFQESNTYYPTTYNIYAEESKKLKHQVTLSDFALR